MAQAFALWGSLFLFVTRNDEDNVATLTSIRLSGGDPVYSDVLKFEREIDGNY